MFPCQINDDLLLMGVDCWESSVDHMPPCCNWVGPWVVRVRFDASILGYDRELRGWIEAIVKLGHTINLGPEPYVSF